jgi:hypothetical protein
MRRTEMPKTIELQIKPNITSDEVNDLLKHIYDLAGCPSCGLLGYDLSIRVLPPELEKARVLELERFDSVVDARISEGRFNIGPSF